MGTDDLACPCGSSILIRGYLPANFLAIRIRCSHCGAVTTTPGLPQDEILPLSATAIQRDQRPMAATAGIALGDILADQELMAGTFALTRPRDWPTDALVVSRSTLETAAADYDRLTGGRLAEHIAASPPPEGAEHGDYPFAWSVARLRQRIDDPEWNWTASDDDAMAAMYLAALRHLMTCWGHHPLLARLAASLAERDRFMRVVTTLAMAKQLFDSGNRVGFLLSGQDVDLHFAVPTEDRLSLALLAPPALQWHQRHRRSPDALQAAVIDAVGTVQGRVNRSRPGIVVLAASILQPDFDQMAIDAIHAAFRSVGRRNRGVAAVAIMLPKLLVAERPDLLGFGYAFYPILNPRFAGENPIRLGSQAEFAAQRAERR